jgi:inhibitor of the pro-sigma K processing machinery
MLKLTIHSCCGFLCLWLLNTVSGFTGIAFPMNAVTILIAGILGLPGIGLLAVLAVI